MADREFTAALRKRANGQGILVAVDGPSGSGKSTVSREVARDLNLAFLETGAMYRALTWLCLRDGVDLTSAEAVLHAAARLNFQSIGSVDEPAFLVSGANVTQALRSTDVAANVSTVASHIPVRQWMAAEQRRQMLRARSQGNGMIAEGRDITTVVCPDADVRVLLVADPEARLKRRVLETYGEVTPELLEKTRSLVNGRDAIDSKVTSFMDPAPGVVTIDSSEMTIPQVVEEVETLVSSALGG